MDISFPADEIAATDDPGGRAGDHRRVVGAIRERRIGDRHAGPAELQNFMAETLAEQGVGRDATGENDGASAELERGSRRLDRQRLDDRFLECGGEVGDWRARPRTPADWWGRKGPLGLVADVISGSRSLSGTRIGSVNLRSAVLRPEKLKSCVPLNQARGSSKASRVAVAGSVLDGRATREAETKQTRPLVECLAGGIVQRAPKVAEAAVPGHQDELRVAAGHQEAEDGKDRFLWQVRCVAQPVGVDVRLEVVDRDERTAERVGHPFGSIHPDDQCTGEPWSLGDGDGVEIVAIDACLPQRLLDHWDDGRHMTSRGKLGHDAAVAFMEVELRRYDRGEDPASSRNDCRRRFVTRRLDAKHDHGNSRSGRNGPRGHQVVPARLAGPGNGARLPGAKRWPRRRASASRRDSTSARYAGSPSAGDHMISASSLLSL